MNDYRNLENKFKSEIELHIKNAMPNLFDSFVQFRQSDDEEDGKLSFDLVFNMNFTISIRIRKHKYLKFNDMTIRYKSLKGYRTEIDKIKDGLAQIYFYAYMSEDENSLCKVRICNVESIRKLIEEKNYKVRENKDGTMLAAFKFKDIANNRGAVYQFN
jgi:hypothetical protein